MDAGRGVVLPGARLCVDYLGYFFAEADTVDGCTKSWTALIHLKAEQGIPGRAFASRSRGECRRDFRHYFRRPTSGHCSNISSSIEFPFSFATKHICWSAAV